jgi:ergothioneine biosynthesis protein EgtB
MATNLAEAYLQTRRLTEWLCEPLETEDYVVQAMPDASPTRWHLAHTTWFFETFVLSQFQPGYHPVRNEYQVLFNSYYNSIGEQFPRARRGLLTRPTVREVFEYRHAVDGRMRELLSGTNDEGLTRVVTLGLEHEQQHQELILTDLKYLLSCNPLSPVYRKSETAVREEVKRLNWKQFEGGLISIGSDGEGFSFDNERPRHQVYLAPYALADRLVTAGEYLEFIHDGGYERPELWLSLGWATVQESGWKGPLYWQTDGNTWKEFTLNGERVVDLNRPVTHVSYFEAEAFARWSNARLPTEAEWEHAVAAIPIDGSFIESGNFHPAADLNCADTKVRQAFGEVWQWTQSPYTPYPGYRPPNGALGEYNGKFMCNQYVLRGGSCATPRGHVRATYRNFFPPDARWQFSGIRLARDLT